MAENTYLTEHYAEKQKGNEAGETMNTAYVKSAVNLYRDPEGFTAGPLLEQGTVVRIIDDKVSLSLGGTTRMLRVSDGTNCGFIRPWYLTYEINDLREENSFFRMHKQRKSYYSVGEAGSLDYNLREKCHYKNTEQIRAMLLYPYIEARNIRKYIELAEGTGINAFVINIQNFDTVPYRSDVMRAYSPSGYKKAINSRQEFAGMIAEIKKAGFSCIGIVSAFQDNDLCEDHPEWAITDREGKNVKLDGNVFWASPFNRHVWEYRVRLAVEAAVWFGLDEIQFDYVRFPLGVSKLVSENRVDLKNEYGENMAQAVQRFLMYAADHLHENGVRISAAVLGETIYPFVSACGQYWPAISNVVDVISGMAYCDNFEAESGWYPWEHPFDTLSLFAKYASIRQTECPAPAIDRTWILCQDPVKTPKVKYGPREVKDEINGLEDRGFSGGIITFNYLCDIQKYEELKSAGVLSKNTFQSDAWKKSGSAGIPAVEYAYSRLVKKGRIRFISILVDSDPLYYKYWPKEPFGEYFDPLYECGTACCSMALSYLGNNATPRNMLKRHNGVSVWTGWGAEHFESTPGTPKILAERISALTAGNGKYSPVMIHIKRRTWTFRGYYMLIIGKLSDTEYIALDPGRSRATSFVRLTIEGLTITDTSLKSVVCPIDEIHQWYLTE